VVSIEEKCCSNQIAKKWTMFPVIIANARKP